MQPKNKKNKDELSQNIASSSTPVFGGMLSKGVQAVSNVVSRAKKPSSSAENKKTSLKSGSANTSETSKSKARTISNANSSKASRVASNINSMTSKVNEMPELVITAKAIKKPEEKKYQVGEYVTINQFGKKGYNNSAKFPKDDLLKAAKDMGLSADVSKILNNMGNSAISGDAATFLNAIIKSKKIPQFNVVKMPTSESSKMTMSEFKKATTK